MPAAFIAASAVCLRRVTEACVAGRGTHLDKLEVIVAELQPAGKHDLSVTDRLLIHKCMHPPNLAVRQVRLPPLCNGA